MPDRSYRWELASDDGLEAGVDIDIGDIVAASADVMELPEAFRGLKGNCSLDEERDGLLPIRITLRNLTDGFSSNPSLYVQWLGNFQIPLDVAVTYSDGSSPSCPSWDSPLGLRFTDLAPEASESATWLVVLRGFYSPAAPGGDLSKFAEQARIELFEGELANGEEYALTCRSSNTVGTHFRLVDDGSRQRGGGLSEAPEC